MYQGDQFSDYSGMLSESPQSHPTRPFLEVVLLLYFYFEKFGVCFIIVILKASMTAAHANKMRARFLKLLLIERGFITAERGFYRER